jgi:hypothetical protein
VRLIIFFALILPLYVLPSGARALASGLGARIAGAIVLNLLGSIAIGFLTNRYRFGVLLYLASAIFELLLLTAGLNRTAAIWVGDLPPALLGIYFAQQLYINMGD